MVGNIFDFFSFLQGISDYQTKYWLNQLFEHFQTAKNKTKSSPALCASAQVKKKIQNQLLMIKHKFSCQNDKPQTFIFQKELISKGDSESI